ncbi:MAG: SRPBCC family protein [Myxococcota bacterium]
MARAEYAAVARLPIETIWNFVAEMDHWAPLVTGYQRHEKQSDTESTWTLKGDVGVLVRTLTFRVRIDEWSPPKRVRFSLEGVNEQMSGGGGFRLEPCQAGDEGETSEPAGRGPRRFFQAVARWLFRLFRGGGVKRREIAAGSSPGASAEERVRLHFELHLEPGGPMAPMIDALIQPMLLPAAEDLANRILAELEARQSDSRPA